MISDTALGMSLIKGIESPFSHFYHTPVPADNRAIMFGVIVFIPIPLPHVFHGHGGCHLLGIGEFLISSHSLAFELKCILTFLDFGSDLYVNILLHKGDFSHYMLNQDTASMFLKEKIKNTHCLLT